MEKELKLKVDTGAITVPIEDVDGDLIGKFKFNPNDLDIAKRCEAAIDRINSYEYKENDESEFYKFCDFIKKEMDYMLNYQVSDQIFAKCNPLSLLQNGEHYIEVVINGITELIDTVMDVRIKNSKVKINKATAKYKK